LKITKGFTGIICPKGINIDDNKGFPGIICQRGINIEDNNGIPRIHMSKRNKH
jgi:hypothetical protein